MKAYSKNRIKIRKFYRKFFKNIFIFETMIGPVRKYIQNKKERKKKKNEILM